MSCGKYINGRIELSTNLRTEQDMQRLIQMLNNCFGLRARARVQARDINAEKDFHVIVILEESVKLLQTIVLPFMLPTLKYKLGLYTN